MTDPELSIIILNYNTKQLTIEAIESIQQRLLNGGAPVDPSGLAGAP